MFCKKCGNKLDSKNKFCTKCGAPIEKNSSKGMVIVIIAILLAVILGLIGIITYKVVNKASSMESESAIDDSLDKIENKDKEKDVAQEEVTTEEVATEEEAAEESETAMAASDIDWQSAYLEYLNHNDEDITFSDSMEDSGYNQYALFYLNDDDIPEVLCHGNCEAAGNIILTCNETGVDSYYCSRLGYSYIERGNKFLNSDGHSGYYYDILIEINDDGKFEQVESGNWSEMPDGDDYENIIYEYYWNDEEIEPEEYTEKLEKCFDIAESSYLKEEDMLSFSDFTKMLSSGDYETTQSLDRYFEDSRDPHRYEYVIENCSFYEAMDEAVNKGGYLVRINSMEEFNAICKDIKDKGLEKNVFWTAGEQDYGIEKHYRWLSPDYRMSKEVIDVDSEFKPMWLEGEPSFSGTNLDGEEVEEPYVVMLYLKSKDKFVLNDVPYDLDAYYKDNMGYIIEYEN